MGPHLADETPFLSCSVKSGSLCDAFLASEGNAWMDFGPAGSYLLLFSERLNWGNTVFEFRFKQAERQTLELQRLLTASYVVK